MTDPRAARLDITNPAHVQFLVDRGLAWKSGPKTLEVIIEHIVSGRVRRSPQYEPPAIAARLGPLGPVEPPLADEPVQ